MSKTFDIFEPADYNHVKRISQEDVGQQGRDGK